MFQISPLALAKDLYHWAFSDKERERAAMDSTSTEKSTKRYAAEKRPNLKRKTFQTEDFPQYALKLGLQGPHTCCIEWNEWMELRECIDFNETILVTAFVQDQEIIRRIKTMPQEIQRENLGPRGKSVPSPRRKVYCYTDDAEENGMRECYRTGMIAQCIVDSTRVLKKLVVKAEIHDDRFVIRTVYKQPYHADSPTADLECLPPELLQEIWLLSNNAALPFASYRLASKLMWTSTQKKFVESIRSTENGMRSLQKMLRTIPMRNDG